MKKIILLLSIFSSFSAFAQNCRLDTLYQYSINVNDIRTPVFRTINSFNSGNLVTKEIKQNRVGNAWENFQEVSITYNSNNKITLNLVKRWVNNAWENFSKTEFTYHTSNKEMENNSYTWNNSNSTWMPNQSFVRTYDANGNELSYTLKTGYLSEWRNNTQSMSEVDANGNVTLHTTLKWNLGTLAWDKQTQISRTYNAYNNKLTEEYRNWNASNSTFVPSTKWIYTYNTDENLTEELYHQWNGISFVSNLKTFYIYNADKNLVTKTTQRYFAEWKTTNKVIYVYNSSKLLITELESTFDLSTGNETPAYKTEYTFNTNSDRTSTAYSSWNGTSYITTQRINYTFNTNNQLTEVLTLLYNQTVMNLVPLTKETYEYDANGLRTSYEVRQSFSIDLGKYQTGARYEYVCTNVSATSINKKIINKINIYPNPAIDNINVTITIPSYIFIYNNLGELVYNNQAENELLQIDLSNFQTGIYIVKIKNNLESNIQKISVVK